MEECDLGLGWGLSGGSSEVDRILGQKVAHLQRAWGEGLYPGQRSSDSLAPGYHLSGFQPSRPPDFGRGVRPGLSCGFSELRCGHIELRVILGGFRSR